MQNPVSIRFASPADADMIASLSRKTFHDTFAHVNTKDDMDKFMNDQFTHEALVAEVKDPSNIFLIAMVDSQTAGYAKMREARPETGLDDLPAIEIARIYAATDMIGKGVGNALMKKCVDIACEMGKRWIWLGVWQQNERAIRFYEKWGFEKFGTHTFVLGNDAQTDWLMKKALH